ncbi:hypothetical protein E2320_002578 [Naja naja]|nr:hypothetical protein E2320_002578 [Naja naja]
MPLLGPLQPGQSCQNALQEKAQTSAPSVLKALSPPHSLWIGLVPAQNGTNRYLGLLDLTPPCKLQWAVKGTASILLRSTAVECHPNPRYFFNSPYKSPKMVPSSPPFST